MAEPGILFGNNQGILLATTREFSWQYQGILLDRIQCEMPLASSFVLSKKKGKEAWIEPIIENSKVHFQVHQGKYPKEIENGTKQGKKASFCCPICKTGLVDGKYVDDEANAGRMGAVPMAIVAEGKRGRIYLSIDETDGVLLEQEIENYYAVNGIEKKVSHAQCRGTFASNAQGRYYGFHEFKDYFTHRQITALTTFSALVAEVQQKAEADAVAVGMVDDHLSLHNSGQNAKAYGEAVGVYLAFVIDRLADRGSSICSWDSSREGLRNTFSIQGIPMAWNCAEGNPFSHSTGSFQSMVEWVTKCLLEFPASTLSTAEQCDAQSDCGLRSVMLSTDPPYYDNVGYADLSDFFYVWLRQSLKDTYPELFSTMLVPKEEELVAIPYRHENSKEKAKAFFEEGMLYNGPQFPLPTEHLQDQLCFEFRCVLSS